MKIWIFMCGFWVMTGAALANCTTTTDKIGQPSSECVTGAVCVHSTTGNEGHCTTDCTWLEKTELIPFYWASHLFGRGEQTYECTETTNLEEVVANGAFPVRYRCPMGTYGRPTDDTSGCTPCPNDGATIWISDLGWDLSAVGGFTIESCMLMAGAVGTDETGTFTVTDNCPWVE